MTGTVVSKFALDRDLKSKRLRTTEVSERKWITINKSLFFKMHFIVSTPDSANLVKWFLLLAFSLLFFFFTADVVKLQKNNSL